VKKLLPERKREKPQIILTNLIDVILLLVFFFMITSSFAKDQRQIPVNVPTAQSGATLDENVVSLQVSENGHIFLSGQEITLAELGTRLPEVLRDSPGTSIVVEADQQVDYGKIIGLLDVVRQAGGSNIGLSVRHTQLK
jgi:biopolymer transport protein ExbD